MTKTASRSHRALLVRIGQLQIRLQTQAAQQLGEPAPAQKTAPAEPPESPATLQQLSNIFALSDFEQEILLLCAGAELAVGWGSLCAAALGDPRRRAPSFELAQTVVQAPHWSAFGAGSPLRHWQLIEVGAGDALITSPLRIDERILSYLLGLPGIDARLSRWLTPVFAPEVLVPSHQQVCDRIVQLWRTQPPPPIQLYGPDLVSQRAIAATACQTLGLTAYHLDLQRLPATESEQRQLVDLWQREGQLGPVALILSDSSENALQRSLWNEVSPVVVVGHEPQAAAIRYPVASPTRPEQTQLWQLAFSGNSSLTEDLLYRITNQFNLSPQQIQTAALQTANDAPDALPTTLWNLCRAQVRPKLADLAQRIDPKESWEDLVLPPAQHQTLQEMVSSLRSQHRVYQDWGFGQKQSRGLGISALFTGSSGTGKTMAAGVIANTLELDLYRIDLSTVVSKYIGETEKNLRQVFDAAESGSVVLLFDEADALFGKRSDVRDSHDRYANMEVSYLLQRMEAYAGLAILTTNLKDSIDPAFVRRLRYIIRFPAPDFHQRLTIWQRVFPAQTPVQDLNYRQLAKLNVTGGLIRNIALTAAFIAAGQDQAISMTHVLQATRREYSKLERPVPAAEIKGWDG
ncbi:MAG: ATP-binding protein [Cyanobacteria bacterium P01_A01_bin.15]